MRKTGPYLVPISEKSGPYLVPIRDFFLVGPDLATLPTSLDFFIVIRMALDLSFKKPTIVSRNLSEEELIFWLVDERV